MENVRHFKILIIEGMKKIPILYTRNVPHQGTQKSTLIPLTVLGILLPPSLYPSARMKLSAVFIDGLKPRKGAEHFENFGR